MATDDQIRTQIRLPNELHVRLALASQVSRRSLNAEMVSRLESTFADDFEQFAIASLRGDLERYQQQVADMKVMLEERGSRMSERERQAAAHFMAQAEDRIRIATAEIEALASGRPLSSVDE